MLPTSSNKPRWLVIVLIAGLCLQIGWYGLIFNQAIHQEKYLRTVDFICFYTAGRIARVGDWGNVYDMQRELAIQSSLAGEPLPMEKFLPYNRPPLLLPLQALMAVEAYTQAYLYWFVIRVLLVLIAGFWIFRMVRRLGWDRLSSWFFTIECILFYPIFIGLVKGQDTGLALLGMVVCLSGLVRTNDMESGLGLSLLVIRPQLALPLALPFIFKRRGVWWWFLGGAALLGLYSVLMVGWQGVRNFLILLAISAGGEIVAIHSFDMYNLMGMLIRSFPMMEMNIVNSISWAVYLLSIVLLCVWWARSSDIGSRHLGLAVILALFVSPHLHDHDLALLLIPAIALCIELVRRNLFSPLASSVLVLGISIYMAVVQLTPMKFIGVYLLMLLMAIALGYLGRPTPSLQPTKDAA